MTQICILKKVRAVPLTGKNGDGKFAIVDFDDFERVSKSKWHVNKGYAERTYYLNGKPKHEKLHRFIFGEVKDGYVIDHINGDKLDNRRENLRECTPTENKKNQQLSIANKSGYKGVVYSEYHGKWNAYITNDKRRKHIGYFETAKEAAKAYDYFASKLHGEFAQLNFPGEPLIKPSLPRVNKFKGIHYSRKDNAYVGRFMYKGIHYFAGQSQNLRMAVTKYNAKVHEILGDEAPKKLINVAEEDYDDYPL
ncbi:HNH endonuclease [Lysinibacillus sp. NPDC097162]|uniref:HNH endonuclease n=1 Tax=Lysinibacillus sp. NPDC097162 TaxID=3364140 RepID=UPI00380BE282